jgi:hypothetical protein
MEIRYRVMAYSQQLNQKQQSMDLTNDVQLVNQAYATQVATAYANRLNSQFFCKTADWVPLTEAYVYA